MFSGPTQNRLGCLHVSDLDPPNSYSRGAPEDGLRGAISPFWLLSLIDLVQVTGFQFPVAHLGARLGGPSSLSFCREQRARRGLWHFPRLPCPLLGILG